jgi:hypothetical protein
MFGNTLRNAEQLKEAAIEEGLKQKATEFKEGGAEIYAKT